MNEELNALRVDAALAGDESQAQTEDKPYLRMAKALKTHAAWKEDSMDPSVTESQKTHLLQMAKNLKEHRAQLAEQAAPASEQPVKSMSKRPWYLWAGAAVAIMAVFCVLFVTETGTIPFKKLGKSAQLAGLSRLSLIIPAANAADAFSMLVEHQDQSGAEVDTAFKIQPKVSVDQDTLNQSLRVIKVSDQGEMPVAYDMQRSGNDYDVKPQQPLDAGSVYRVVIATAVKDDKGELRQRDFSWAVQTKDTFRIIRSVPGYAATGVPLNTSIEVMLSQTGWSDPTASFDIQPPATGRFETHGRTLVFLPDKPLATSTLYSVTYKKGWGVGNGLSLPADYVIRFQTAGDQAASGGTSFLTDSYLAESAPGTEPIIGVSSDKDQLPVEVVGYSLSWDDAKTAVQKIEQQPMWIDPTETRNKTISDLAKSQIFTQSAKLEAMGNWSKAIRLSDSLQPGIYALKLTQGDQRPVWMILQITKLAAYMMADRKQILVWTVNTETQKPVGVAVDLDGQKVQTDTQGLAHLDAPAEWQKTDSQSYQDRQAAVLDLGDGEMRLLAVLRNRWGYSYYGSYDDNAEASFNTWSYLFADRPLYRSQDKINVFGLLKDRDTNKGLGKATVQLENYGVIDFGTYESKVFAKAELTTDDAGFFQGQIAWQGSLSPGYYNLNLYRDGKRVASRAIEIKDAVKPAYYLQIVPDKKSVFAGDQIKGQVVAKFFDGTPVARARLSLNAYGGFSPDGQTAEVTTDDMGYAAFNFKTGTPACNVQEPYVVCSARDTMTVEARPALGEEGEIYGTASFNVWRNRVSLGSESEEENQGAAVIKSRVRQVVLESDNGRDDDSVLGDGVSNATVKARVIEQHWDKVQTGTTYDPIEKVVVPQYRYDQRDVEVGNYEGKTDAGGYVAFNFSMQDNMSYRVVVSTDEGGPEQAYTAYISKGWYDRSGDDTPTLVPTSAHDQKSSYALGEKVSISFMQSGQKLSSDNASFLFVHAARGLRQSEVSADATHEFDFTDEDIPNMTVYGIAFLKNGFVVAQYSASFDAQQRGLNVVLTPDKTSYAPGEQAVFHAKVTDKGGNPVADARVAVSVADEALLSIAQLDSPETPLESIYSWLPDGIIASAMSHTPGMEMGAGGAEMGGGGGRNAVRSNFKDQATFMTLRTTEDGTATGSFTMPDNLTSWRFTAVAVTPDLRAGTARLNVPTTKPLFVEAVIPQNILVSDKAVLKLRAFGTALPQAGEVTYTVDVPTLGINNQEVKGPVGKAVYLALEHPVAGEHKAVISVSLDGSTKDAIERTIKIVSSRATHDERVTVELAPGTELPDIGQTPEVQVTFESKARGAARTEVEDLANPWSARLESAVAGRVARELLRDYYQSTSTDPNEIQASKYQRPSGGLGVLPYSSEDVALSSKVAAADPDGVDRSLLANYFWTITDDQSVSREESIQALAGLAALGQPVIERLHSLMEIKDLTWREDLALIRGLDAIGDREAARGLLDTLLTKSEEHDNVMVLSVSKSQAENIEATAEAAAIAAAMSHPAAAKLAAYVETNWNSDTLTDLDRAMYLQKVVPTLVPADVSLTYAIGQETKTIDLKQQPVYTVRLTADEAKAFRAVSVNGPAVASFIKRATGDTIQSSDLLEVDRVYKENDKPAETMHEGDLVTVSLTAHWDQKAQDGCYTLRDRLPAAMLPVVNISFDRYQTQQPLYYPYDTTGNEVSFVVCKQAQPFTLNYLARVVSLGTYTASGALLQSMDTPSLAAQSAPQTLEIK